MKRTTIVVATVLLVWIVPTWASSAESAPPQHELKTYALHGKPRSADVSPDEKLVVTEISRPESADDPSKIKTVDVVQLWDFRQDRLIAEKTLRESVADKEHQPTYPEYPFVRYSADGQIVAAYLDRSLYVLRSNDLQEIRRIPNNGPPGVTHTYKTKSGVQSFVEKPQIVAFELSPTEHEVAVVWVQGMISAWVEIVQLDSGKVSVWNTHDRGLGWYNPKAIAWESDGQRLVVAVPNAFPCQSPGNAPDVFVVEPRSGTVSQKLTTGLLVGDVAVTPDNRVLAVDYDCLGVVVNHHPKMRIFDLGTGKLVKELSGRGSGVRYSVSASRNGDRAVAYTGKMKVLFDWGDMVPMDSYVDHTFSVWSLKNYRGQVTSQNLSPRESVPLRFRPHSLRISPGGGFVLYGENIYAVQ